MKKALFILMVSAIILTPACSGKKSEVAKANYQPIDPSHTSLDPSEIYADIAEISEHHIGPTKRFTYHVVISQRLDKAMLEEIAMYMYEKAQKETPFNALSVGFYDYPQFIGNGYRFGYAEFAPNGEWGKANTVKTGDYSTMLMEDHLEEPNWDYALTRQEADIFYDYDILEDELSENAESGDDLEKAEKTAIQQTAQKYNITPESVEAIILKYLKIKP
jgi:hypothetical protein